MEDYFPLIKEIAEKIAALPERGKVADYIPELAFVPSDKLGVHLTTVSLDEYGVGESDEKFSIQSIVKVLTLALAYNYEGDSLWHRVGVEPSGTPFNSLVQLEFDKGIPRNPMINSGALVVCDILLDHFKKDPKEEFLEFVRDLSGRESITYNEMVAQSELDTAWRNAAHLNLMKSFGNIKNNISDVMDFYCHICALEMTCKELAHTFLFLANKGINPFTKKRVITSRKTKRLNAIMQLCGFYDEAGEFSFKVGLPGKSGVGGGIVTVLPKQYAIAVWSPALNKKGNSYKGVKFLEEFTTRTDYSIF